MPGSRAKVTVYLPIPGAVYGNIVMCCTYYDGRLMETKLQKFRMMGYRIDKLAMDGPITFRFSPTSGQTGDQMLQDIQTATNWKIIPVSKIIQNSPCQEGKDKVE